MQYIIDGHNLIGKCQSIQLSDPDKEHKCIDLLLKKSCGKKDHILIVFDGKGALNTWASKQKKHNISYVFTSIDESADDYIKRLIISKRKQSGLIIVSSDREIQYSAKKNKLPFLKSEDFINNYHPTIKTSTNERNISSEEIEFWLEKFDEIE